MTSLSFDIQKSTEFCSTHQTQMVSYRGRPFCKQCSLELLDRGQKEHHHAVNTMVREKHFAGARLPRRHQKSGFSNYQVLNNGQQNAKAQCASFAKDFIGDAVRNLIMVGRTGTGKTHLACAVARNVLDKRKPESQKPTLPSYLTQHQAVGSEQNQFNAGQPKSLADMAAARK